MKFNKGTTVCSAVLIASLAHAQTPPTTPVQRTQVEYHLGHGISSLGTPNPNEQMGLIQNWLTAVPQQGRIYNPSYDMRHTILQQSNTLKDQINATSQGTPKVLIGYSMGGLRARGYLQLLNDNVTNTNKNNIKGLITLDTPHYGAPVIDGAPGFTARLTTDLVLVASVLGGAFSSLAYLGFTHGTPLGWQAGEIITFFAAGGTKNDLRPNSAFINAVNAAPEKCHWDSRVVTKRVLWWSWQETVWTKICVKTPNPNPIPPTVNTLSVRGLQNNITQAIPVVGTIANSAKWVMSGAAATCWAAAFWTFGATIPCALGATDGAYVFWNLDNVWANQVVGQNAGDSIVPLKSQNMYENLKPELLGGTPVKEGFADNVTASHVGDQGVLVNFRTRQLIQEFQKETGLVMLP